MQRTSPSSWSTCPSRQPVFQTGLGTIITTSRSPMLPRQLHTQPHQLISIRLPRLPKAAIAETPMITAPPPPLTRQPPIHQSDDLPPVKPPAVPLLPEEIKPTFRGRVVIVGAGISGASAALAFAKNGYHVTVVDKRPAPQRLPGNHHVTLSGRGLQALQKLGVQLPPESYTRGSFISWYPNGGSISKSMYRKESVHIDRVQLAQQLVEIADKRYADLITFSFRSEVCRMELEQGMVQIDTWQLRYGGGDTPPELRYRWVPFDLLVAADGTNSTVREFAEEHSNGEFQVDYQQRHIKTGFKVVPHLRSAELAAMTKGARVNNFIPTAGSPYRGLTAHMTTNSQSFSFIVYRKIGTWLRSKDDIVKTLISSFPQLPRSCVPALASGILAALEGIAGPVIRCPRLYYRNVLLLGDAGHACTNGLGQAGNCALEDAAVLDDVLAGGRDSQTLQQAAVEWDTQRREEVKILQELELDCGLLYPGQMVGQLAQGLAFRLLWGVNSWLVRLGFLVYSSGFRWMQVAGGSYKAAKDGFQKDCYVMAGIMASALLVMVMAGLAAARAVVFKV